MIHKASLALAFAAFLLSGVSLCMAEKEPNEPVKNPLKTLEDIQRLLDERGDELSAQERGHLLFLLNIYQTPIHFWGRVVDENGRPIPGAKVHVTVGDDPSLDWEEDNSSEYDLIADEQGRVSLIEQKGVSIKAKASAEGYATAYSEGERDLSEAELSINVDKENRLEGWPTKDKPAVLVMRKKGPIPRIKYRKARYLRPMADGQLMNLDIHDGKYVVEIRFWSAKPENFKRGDQWDWRVEYKPVGGQIRRRLKDYPHAAPIDDFEDKHEVVMKASDEDWRSHNIGWRAEYWVRWSDGTHAMVNLGIETKRQPRLIVESWINLDRNRSFEDFKAATRRELHGE